MIIQQSIIPGNGVGKFEYAGWYPIMRLYGDYGKENSSYYQINRHYNSRNTLIGQDTVSVPYKQTVMNLRVDGAIPLDFSKGKMFRLVQPEFQIGLYLSLAGRLRLLQPFSEAAIFRLPIDCMPTI